MDLDLKTICLEALNDLKAQDIIVLDIRDISGFADWLVIATASSSTNAKAIANKLIESINLLSDSMESFNKNCLTGLKANKAKINQHLNNSLMLVTALNKKIGYYKAAEIANKAHENGTTLEEEAIKSGYLTKKQFKDWVKPEDMV